MQKGFGMQVVFFLVLTLDASLKYQKETQKLVGAISKLPFQIDTVLHKCQIQQWLFMSFHFQPSDSLMANLPSGQTAVLCVSADRLAWCLDMPAGN